MMLLGRLRKIWMAMVMVWLMSCINTSYSRLDEVEITGNELDLVLGQFAHHGARFYENEVTRTKAILLENENDFVARNDLASAYIKLKEYEKAVAEFNKNEERHPGKYETAANRGVLYKKMGKYELAADFIAESLMIKEEGHMGLGDYYLRMIKWLNTVEKNPNYLSNFLEVEYLAGSRATASSPLKNKEYLLTLIKNDYGFADVYFVLGDVYLNEKEYQLAIRCYHRAIDLGHHMSSVLRDRLNGVGKELLKVKSDGQLVEASYMSTHGKQVEQEILAAEEWLTKYQELEAELIEEGKSVDFKSMKAELEARDIRKPKVKEAMIYKGEIIDENESVLTQYYVSGGYLTKIILVMILVALFAAVFFIVRLKRERAA